MPKNMHVLKPNLVNALAPVYAKILVYSLPVFVMLFAASYFTDSSFFSFFNLPITIGLWLVLSLIPLSVRIFLLSVTKYIFYHSHLEEEFKFIIVRRYAAPYSQIVNVRTKINVWDRICNAGDIIIHTAENNAPDLVLRYIKDPDKVEKGIFNLIHKARGKS